MTIKKDKNVNSTFLIRVIDGKIVAMYDTVPNILIWVLDKNGVGFHFKCKDFHSKKIITQIYRRLTGVISQEDYRNHELEGIRINWDE
jgi:hypothetical protein